MTPDFISLLTRPDRAWTSIRQKEDANSLRYLMHLLLLALIPSVCLFIGITYVGWSLVDEERVRLAADSAFQLCLFLYITMVLGTVIMGLFVHWMARSFDVRPSLNLCIGFIAYTITPFFVAGIAGLYPNRWFAAIVILLAGLYSTYLLFTGLPAFMRQRSSQSFLYASSIWGVALLVIVTVLVSMILFWSFFMEPTYTRTVQENQSYGTQQERPQEEPGGL
ncbi:Yip1 family protein [Stutzerimonas nitrititolerans]|uniref:YIP1 family protein n=1 Tax=Stutzerimonas nitrititolerans TaxID=2482751 RepID=A0ABX9V654_9GAMM|nr:Yip1 family protein [Stutzerimonas nitrititolerans]RMI01453.1 YIP1 family protein [Stutzerimonas nitrititolerans]